MFKGNPYSVDYNKPYHGLYLFTDDGSLAVGRVYFVSADSVCSTFANFLEIPTFNTTCVLTGRELAVALAMDVRAELMFFSDVGRRIIQWVRLIDGEHIQTLIGGTGSVEGEIPYEEVNCKTASVHVTCFSFSFLF